MKHTHTHTHTHIYIYIYIELAINLIYRSNLVLCNKFQHLAIHCN
jgi:hypothetical protein